MTDENGTRGLDEYIDVVAAMVDLPIAPASKPIVREHLEVAARMAKLVSGFDIDQREEPAPTFRPEART